MTFYQGYGNNSKKLFFSDYSESISSHHGFLTFLGNNRTSNDGRLQYYFLKYFTKKHHRDRISRSNK